MRLVVAVIGMAVVTLQQVAADEGDDRLARELARVAKDPRQSLDSRVAAARMLGQLQLRAAAAVPDLVAVLEGLRGNELEPLQEAIVTALGQIGSPARSSLPTLARVSDRSVDLRAAVKKAASAILAAPDDQDVIALTYQLQSGDPSIRLRAVKALMRLGPAAASAVPVLNRLLEDTDADVRRAAIVAIQTLEPAARPSPALIQAIAKDLNDEDPLRRFNAARQLGRIGSPASVVSDALEARRNDPDPDVRRAVTDALNRIFGPPPP